MTMNAVSPVPILIDCDPGHDDAIALVMAHRSPAIDLLAVTTTCGNAGIDKTTRNCLRVLEFIGASDVPVAAGCVRPLARPLVLGTADGPSGLEGSPYLPEPTMALQPMHAVELLAQKLREAPAPMDFVATGPLTNLGLLFLKYPDVVPKIKMLTWMGGVFYRKSEIISPTEFNAFCDPEALKIVLDVGVPITMVGLDVTRRVLVEAPQFEKLSEIDTPSPGTPISASSWAAIIHSARRLQISGVRAGKNQMLGSRSMLMSIASSTSCSACFVKSR
jgi:pyrimidine-specific ribonucleoside hydrolase